MKKFLLSMVTLASAMFAQATDTVLWEGTQVIGWNQSCAVAASKCTNMQADQQIIVEYTCQEGADYYSLGLIKGNWGDWPAGTWATGGVAKGTTSMSFDIFESCLPILKSEGFFLMGYGLEVHRIIWRDEVRDKSVLLDEALTITNDSEGLTFTYDQLIAAGAETGGGVQVEYAFDEGGYINYMHQGDADNEYTWCEFSNLQVSEADGVSILILNKETMDEINSFSKTLVVQAGHCTINKVKVIKPLDVPGTSIVLDKSEAEVMAGSTIQLSATTNPTGQKVTWTSSDEAIATVDYNGIVTGVAEGTVTITAAAGAGSATCIVTVTPAMSIILKWTDSFGGEIYGDAVDIEQYVAYNETPKLWITTIPEDAKVSISYSCDPTSSFRVYSYPNNKYATASLLGPGTATFTVTITGTDVTAVATVTAVELDAPTVKIEHADSYRPAFDTLLPGDRVMLYSMVCPDDYSLDSEYYDATFEWESSDPEVVAVEPTEKWASYSYFQDIVTYKPGTATITAKAIVEGHDPIVGTIDVTVLASGKLSAVYNFNVPNRGSSYNWKTAYDFPADATTIEDFTFVANSNAGNPLVNFTVSAGNAQPITFTEGATLTFEALDPYMRIISVAASASATTVDNTKTLDVTGAEGTVEGATWTANKPLTEATLTATGDVAVSTLTYWHVGLMLYAQPESVALDKESIEGKEEETAQLAATYAPEDALPGLEFAWTSDNEDVATVDETGLVTLVAEGTANITATLTAPAPTADAEPIVLTASCPVTVEALSGIEDVAVDSDNAPVEFYNVNGMRVDGSNLTPGIYIRRQGTNATKVLVK